MSNSDQRYAMPPEVMAMVNSLPTKHYQDARVTERGMLLGGAIVEGTEWVLRDPEAWWPDGDHSTRSRAGAIVDVLTLHWTAGHISHEDDAGPRTYRAMRSRKSKTRPGQPLDVAVNFVVGWGGSCWQLADVLTATVHVGDRGVIRRSVGVECRWPGTRRQAERLGIDGAWATVRVDGDRVEVMLPSQELRAASRRLAETLCALRHPRIAIPRQLAPSGQRFTREQQRAFAGVEEHGQLPGSRKIDCAGLLTSDLADHGWPRAML